MKVAVIVGHEKVRPGARLCVEEYVSEYMYNKIVAQHLEGLAKQNNLDLMVIYRDQKGRNGAYREAEKNGADLIIELHFNSAANPEARGCEVICSGKHAWSKFCDHILAEMEAVFGGPIRGIKVPRHTDRGWANVTRPLPYFLLEPFFGSNHDQASIALSKTMDYAQGIVRAINKYKGDQDAVQKQGANEEVRAASK